jgi:hypothetical protein
MTDKEIRHLSKTELLSIIRDQEQELQQVKKQAEELRLSLDDRRSHIDKCGSIAEASLQMNQVFQSAQAAAEQYLAEIREKRDRADADAQEILAEAGKKAEEQIKSSKEICGKIEEESRNRADAYWSELQKKLEAFYESRKGLKQVVESCGIDVRIPNSGVKNDNDRPEGSASES